MAQLTGERPLRVEFCNARRPVAQYITKTNSVVLKFYGADPVCDEEKRSRMTKEYWALSTFFQAGLSSPPERVVKPLGEREDLWYAIAEERAEGSSFLQLLREAGAYDLRARLAQPIRLVASLLFKMHSSLKPSSSWWIPDWEKKIRAAHLTPAEEGRFAEVFKAWKELFPLPLPLVPLHGDPNPTNIIVDSSGIVTFDLQMFHYGYPVEDLGEVAAELKFAFLQYANNPSLAEPYIASLYAEYSELSGIPFSTLTAYNPLYMGLWEMGMASNAWLSENARSWLIRESYKTLKFGLKLARGRVAAAVCPHLRGMRF